MNSKNLLLLGLLVFGPLTGRSQNYSIDWFTIDGGGGTSTGGVYSVSGTIGQPDAGRMTGASYALDGGFWGFVGAVQTVGAPLLSIERLGTSVRVFWPRPATDFVLDRTPALGGPPGSWLQVGFPYQTNASEISITVPAPVGTQFYRLRKP
jgi:hypothetical protein